MVGTSRGRAGVVGTSKYPRADMKSSLGNSVKARMSCRLLALSVLGSARTLRLIVHVVALELTHLL